MIFYFLWRISSFGDKTTGYRKNGWRINGNLMTFFTVSSIIGRQFLIQTTMSYVVSLGNLLTRAFIYLSFSSGSSGNGELLLIHFLCRYCYCNHSRSIYVVNEQCAWVLCKCLKQCNVQCAFQKCIAYMYIHLYILVYTYILHLI